MKTGQGLIDDVNACRVPPGQCALWWLGQHGFIVKLADTVCYIDVFFTELSDRLVRPLLAPREATNADLVLGSHDHLDHIDRPAWPVVAAASPEAIFVVPELVRGKVSAELNLSPQRIRGVEEGLTVRHRDVTITAIGAAHEFLDTDPATGRHPYVGFIITGNGFSLYHAGDTCLYEGIHDRLRGHFGGPGQGAKLDLMILPINGRDAARLASGCIGNMTYQEAADLAGSLAPGAVIPAHYDMFAMNSADVRQFARYMQVKYPGQAVIVPDHGRRVLVPNRPV